MLGKRRLDSKRGCLLQDAMRRLWLQFPRRLHQEIRGTPKGNEKASNARAEHADDHSIDWDNAAKEKNPTTRLLLESVFIETTEDTINRTDGSLPAPIHYVTF